MSATATKDKKPTDFDMAETACYFFHTIFALVPILLPYFDSTTSALYPELRIKFSSLIELLILAKSKNPCGLNMEALLPQEIIVSYF